VVTSTTSTVGPNDRVAAPPVVDQYVQASGQSAQAAALHHTSPTSTSHQLVPGLRQCRSMRVRAPLPQPLPLRSPSVSSWTPLSPGCPAATKEGALPAQRRKRQGAHDYFWCVYRPSRPAR